MAEDSLSLFPVPLAIRLVLDSVSYSNPLPDWFDTLTIDYAARGEAIRRRIKGYLEGAEPKQPFEIMVPKKNGQMARWVIPSVNDQIVIQACVSSMADAIDEKGIDQTRVFSCRYNRDPNRLALLENQVAAWKGFQDETNRRCESERCLLQIDLEDAFGTIDRARFFDFLKRFSPSQVPVKLLRSLLDTLSGDELGLPLMNDSVFFLGNAYFSEIDKLITRHTTNFIRFVDDYRIFDDSPEKLESLLRNINRDLEHAGFRVNSHKLRLGGTEEYLEAISNLKYATNPVADYIDVAFGDILQPEEMVAQIVRTLENPQEFLSQGFGRLQLASLRRLHVDALVAEKRKGYLPYSARYAFVELLLKNEKVVGRILELLRAYVQDKSQLWRTLWLLYLIKDLYFYWEVGDSGKPPADLVSTLTEIRDSQTVPLVARLWASELPTFGGKQSAQDLFEQLHESDYLECGIRCVGAHKHE